MRDSGEDWSIEQGTFADLDPGQILDAVESVGYGCRGTFLALNSYENRVYRIDLEAPLSASEPGAAGDTRLVAKFYRPGRWRDATILEEHRFTAQLAEAELPVIAPLTGPGSLAGQTLFTFGQHRFALYPCRGGRAPELDNPAHLEQLGRLIGRMHGIGAAEPFAYRPVHDIDTMGEAPRAYLLQSDALPDYLRDNYAAITGELLVKARQRVANAGQVARLRLHGDLHPGNVLWTGAGPHLVDFDDARSGPAVQDLWMFLSGDRAYMTARLGDLLAGYTQFRDFDPLELHWVEALRTLRIIHHVAWIARRWRDPAFPIAFPGFGEAAFWQEHLDTLREQGERLAEPPLVWD